MTSVSVQKKAQEFDEKNKLKANKVFGEKPQRKSVVSKNNLNNTIKSKSRNKSIKGNSELHDTSPIRKQ